MIQFEGPGPVVNVPTERRVGYLIPGSASGSIGAQEDAPAIQFEGPGSTAEVTHVTHLPVNPERNQDKADDISHSIGQAATPSLVEVEDKIFIRSIN